MRLPTLVAIISPLLVAAIENDNEYRILHRVYGPGVPERPFSIRATLDPKSLQLDPAPQYLDDLGQFYSDARQSSSALYQVALHTPESILAGDRLSISSVKACHIPLATQDFFTFHLDSDAKPFHVDYYLANVPQSGACPSKKQLRSVNQETFLNPSNTSIRVQHATHPPPPGLRVPPPLTPKGQPVAPVPEKSFIQKYWLYIVIGLGAFLLVGPPPEEGQSGEDSGQR